MLRMCLERIRRYTPECKDSIIIAADCNGNDFDAWDEVKGIPVLFHQASASVRGSERHVALLDATVKIVQSKYLLTLDSDCFPIHDFWLNGLFVLNATVAGILHPWSPSPPELSRDTMDYRIRRSLCWNNTHVACQLCETDFIRRHGIGYGDGDDTGLSIPMKAHELGLKVSGYMPTRCPLPDNGDFDPEWNRDCCVVFGDSVYHHGGASRENECHLWPSMYFKEERRRIEEEGPEFLLDEGYQYRFDREEEVVKHKLTVMFDGMKAYLAANPGGAFK